MKRPSFFSSADEEPLLRAHRADRGKRLAWFILLLALAATLLAWSLADRAIADAAAARFDSRLREVINASQQRIGAYEQVLHSSEALLRASEAVSLDEWRDFAASLDLRRRYPGMEGLGFAPWVRRAELDELQQRLAAERTPPPRIYPPGARPHYAPVIYLAPLEGGTPLLGFDLYTHPELRAAMERARDTGGATLTAPVTRDAAVSRALPLFLYLPVFRGRPTTPAQRQRQLLGFVFAPLALEQMITSALEPLQRDVALTIYDGTAPDAAHRIYTNRAAPATARAAHRAHATVTIANHPWTFQLRSLPSFERGEDLQRQRIILGSGTVISLLLFAITWTLASTRARALAIAQRMTRELREERLRLIEMTETMGEGLYVQDNHGIITFCNRPAAHLLGREPQRLVGTNSMDLIPPQARDAAVGSVRHALERATSDTPPYVAEEGLFMRRDGTPFPVSVITSLIVRDGRPAGAVVSFHDLTDQQRAAVALREAQQFAHLFQYSTDALFLMDLDGRLIDANRVALESLGYTRDELIGSPSAKYVRWSTVPALGQTVAQFFSELREGRRVRGEAEHVRKDGSSFFVDAAFSLIEHEQQRMVLVSARDISARKEAERRMQRAVDELERSRHEVEEVNRRLAESNRELQSLSRRDGLTGIANRRSFDEYLTLEWNRAARDNRPLSLLMVDVDHFKAYNDYYGHQAGDDCLRRLAENIDRQLGRSIDIVARYGGEEFAVVLPETPLTGAANIAERLRHSVEALAMEHATSPVTGQVTISIGVASIVPSAESTPEGLVTAADAALYRAKQSGRNRVCTADAAAS